MYRLGKYETGILNALEQAEKKEMGPVSVKYISEKMAIDYKKIHRSIMTLGEKKLVKVQKIKNDFNVLVSRGKYHVIGEQDFETS